MGKLFVIDGLDGCGKETQSQLLVENLKAGGIKAMRISFPCYDMPEASGPVVSYLKGELGSLDDISPHAASVLFAVDRFVSSKIGEWKKFYDDGGVIIADRYVSSNLLYQATRIKEPLAIKTFSSWLNNLEYNVFKLPVPDRVFYLDVPYNIAFKLMEGRKNKIDGSDTKDIHESDLEFLKQCHRTAISLADKQGWDIIRCSHSTAGLKTVKDINKELFNKVTYLLGDKLEG